jgi:small-conductance mechanosensitive channel
VGLATASDLALAASVATEAAASVAGVADEPAPHALVGGVGSSTVDLDVRFWCDARRSDVLVTTDRVVRAVVAALTANGVDLPPDIVRIETG